MQAPKLSRLPAMVRKQWAMLGRQAPEVMDTAEDSKLRPHNGLRPLRPRTSTTVSAATRVS